MTGKIKNKLKTLPDDERDSYVDKLALAITGSITLIIFLVVIALAAAFINDLSIRNQEERFNVLERDLVAIIEALNNKNAENAKDIELLRNQTDGLKTVYEVIKANSILSILGDSLQKAELVETLNAADAGYTVFAPSNSAFDDTELSDDTNELANVLKYHVIPTRYSLQQLSQLEGVQDGVELETLTGETLTIKYDNGIIYVNDIRIIQSDLEADNGVVHMIGGVLTR